MLKGLEELHQSERAKNRLLSGVSDAAVCDRFADSPNVRAATSCERLSLDSFLTWIRAPTGWFLNTLRKPLLPQFHLLTPAAPVPPSHAFRWTMKNAWETTSLGTWRSTGDGNIANMSSRIWPVEGQSSRSTKGGAHSRIDVVRIRLWLAHD
jgi:hypothetical protein